VIVKLLDPELYAQDVRNGTAFPPRHRYDAGIDLRVKEDVRVIPGEATSIELGIAVAIPRYHVGWITGRSTTALKLGLHVAEGTIDSGYRGELHCFVTAQGTAVQVRRGDRLCQLVVLVMMSPAVEVVRDGWPIVDDLPKSYDDRDLEGLGSTGLR